MFKPLNQVYHSSFVDEQGITKACGCPLLPLKSHIKGPAPVSEQGIIKHTFDFRKKKKEEEDILINVVYMQTKRIL